jgi:hypothetical protein
MTIETAYTASNPSQTLVGKTRIILSSYERVEGYEVMCVPWKPGLMSTVTLVFAVRGMGWGIVYCTITTIYSGDGWRSVVKWINLAPVAVTVSFWSPIRLKKVKFFVPAFAGVPFMVILLWLPRNEDLIQWTFEVTGDMQWTNGRNSTVYLFWCRSTQTSGILAIWSDVTWSEIRRASNKAWAYTMWFMQPAPISAPIFIFYSREAPLTLPRK